MPLSDDLNRTRLKRRIDELHVDVRRLQRPQERHKALKELDQLTVEYIRALCTEMKYVFQQSALLQEELQPDPEPALATTLFICRLSTVSASRFASASLRTIFFSSCMSQQS